MLPHIIIQVVFMRYFGTDGIRRKSDFFTGEYLDKVADALTSLKTKLRIAVASDPRTSGARIEKRLTSRLVRNGAAVITLGITATPVLAFYTKQTNCDYGIMISASHNPPEYNGIKFFDEQGRKIPESLERKLECLIDCGAEAPFRNGGTRVFADADRMYLDYFSDIFKDRIKVPKVLLDTSNGATAYIAPRLFRMLGCETDVIFNNTSGEYINCGCGAASPEAFLKEVREKDYFLGFCFDGDGDRVLACCGGKVLDGDHLMYIFARYLQERKELSSRLLVGTIMTNSGVEAAAARKGFVLRRTAVGDKFIAREMQTSGAEIGGEASGHVIVSKYQNTGDGLLAAMMLMAAISAKPLEKYDDIQDYPQMQGDIVTDIKKIEQFRADKGALDRYIKRLLRQSAGRLVIRPSGTEPVIRVMAEAPTMEEATMLCKKARAYVIRRINGYGE
jgi:phosphoglucosamine mutase